MKGSFKLGNIAGIGIFIHWTFSILIAFIIFSNYRQGQSAIQILWSVLFVISIFITVFLHELGHALAAKRYNINTKDITLLPIGGLARLERIPEKPSEELVVAIAGPTVNIALAAITGLLISVPDTESMTLQLTASVNSSNFFLNFLVVNIWLALFNLIPAFPMDGGRVLRAILSMNMDRRRATNIAAKIGQVLAMVFVFIGFYANPFLIFIGLFIFLGAQAEASMTQAKFILAGYTVNDVLMRHYETISASDTVKTAVSMLLNGQTKTFLVTENEVPVGTVSRDEIILALSNKGENEIISRIMNNDLLFLDADTSLEKAYLQMQQHKSTLMPVMLDQKLIGTVDNENILEFLMVKNASTTKE
ncbi:MAG: site-2 protease family protein [Cyclobacteriaceae bacterium]|nr:site-2 protease family protein [Cyclobacteriaceae bacterium]MDH4296152.1 site-2 protease family protein [Cyclobacteriaceae bacterium]MDH5249745.1 site-2 protease family protein [Cyclobacteriaceae bacterium]